MDMYGEYLGIERVKICVDVDALSRQVVMAGDL